MADKNKDKNKVEDDPWGDDDGFDLILATQEILDAEERHWAHNSEAVVASGSGEGGSISPTEAAQAFAYRRQNLQLTEGSEPFQLSETMMAQDPQACIAQIKNLYTIEKTKNQKLANDLLAAQGESGILRRQVDSLKHSQTEEALNRIKRDREDKLKSDTEKKNLEKEVKALRTELRIAHDNVANARSKVAMFSAGKLSVGGAKALGNTSFRSSTSPGAATAGPSSKFRSDPNLTKTSPRNQQIATSPSAVPPEPKRPKIEVVSKSIQAIADVVDDEFRDSKVFGTDSINISHAESVAATKISETRQLIFFKLKSLIEKGFISVSPELENIVAVAPKEIMRKFVRFTASKTHFADVINSMFQWGVEYQRKKEAQATGERIEIKYPNLPSVSNPPILDTSLFLVNLEQHFVYGSAWDALLFVKNFLKKLLNGLEGDGRFRLYEIENLRTLWSSLSWAESLWKFILFEEELEGVVEVHGGKKIWAQELEDWTGLTMKIDWRDFYVPELESIVRSFSLSILETIVTLGYFEQKRRRYEILYCILKDTLTKDIHRNEKTIKNCLSIVTWCIADKTIFNYLCSGSNDGECLAYLLGEFVLKCFRETENRHLAANLVVYYFNFLETLMVDPPYYYFASKIARPNANILLPQNEKDTDKGQVQNASENMDVDEMMSSQFVCPDKFQEEGVREKISGRSMNVELHSCWILPQHWELIGAGSPEEKPCQCRKVLLGSAFIMLHSIMGFWKQSFVKGEMKIDEMERLDEKELQKFEEIFKVSQNCSAEEHERYAQLSEKVKSLREFVLKSFNPSEDENQEDSRRCLEWTWDELLAHRTNLYAAAPEEPAWVKEKRRPDNIFDCLIKHGMVLMHFLDNEKQNMAMTIGSEAFFCFTSLASDFRFYVNNIKVTEVEHALISEFTSLDDQSDESIEESERSPVEDETDSEDEFNNDESIADLDAMVMPEFDALNVADITEDNFVKSTFTDDKFDKAFKCFELEREKELFG